MAATFAVVGAEGCRRPIEKIVPYTKMPEDVIPGVPSHYATVIQHRGDALGLVLESHEGRPTKVEGNEAHPSSLGAADAHHPGLDPGSLRSGSLDVAPQGRRSRDVGALRGRARREARRVRQGPGRAPARPHAADGLAHGDPHACRARSSASRRRACTRGRRCPISNVHAGAKAAFGEVLNVLVAYDKAHVILALDSDFLQTESGSVRAGKLFAAGRRLKSSRDAMSRLYVVEPARTTTGNVADHRLRLPASEIAGYAFALAGELAKAWRHRRGAGVGGQGRGAAEGSRRSGSRRSRRSSCRTKGRAIIVVGSRQPAEVHALAHAINAALSAVPTIVQYAPVADPDELDVRRPEVADGRHRSQAGRDARHSRRQSRA